jgi:hypothetical protein
MGVGQPIFGVKMPLHSQYPYTRYLKLDIINSSSCRTTLALAVPIGKHRESGIQHVKYVVWDLTFSILDAGLHRHDENYT